MNRLLPLRLRSRLALKQTISFALLVSLLAWGAYVLLSHRIYEQLDDELQDRAIAVRSMLQVRNGEFRWLNKEADREVREHFERSARFFELADDHGNSVDHSQEMAALGVPFSAVAQRALVTGEVGWETFTPVTGAPFRILNTPVSGLSQKRYLLRLGLSMREAEEDCARLRLFLLLLLPAVFLIHLVNSWLVTGNAMRPLEQITAAAALINPLDPNSRLPVFDTNDELEQLSLTLNSTISRLQGSFHRMSEFLRNLAHEVRQPLTVMRAEAEQALRQSDSEQRYREMFTSQLQHVELLARTVSDVMEMAQSDSDQIKLHRQQEDLSELVQTAIDGMRAKSNEHNIHICGTVQQNVIGQFDAGQIWRLILNLLDNAIKYNKPDGRIEVSLNSHQGTAILSITDTGVGMTLEEQDHIFERGFRTAGARKSNVSGTGLGLCFARSIAEAHGGTIEISSKPGQGSSFRVVLPLQGGPSAADCQLSPPQESAIH